ncbi:hypothetical protein [Pseudosporangium ferrugineum]|uniref:Uncharacterized protein n=1 Tax=Pseudosporangium ferrugineum TaxID=439699 RepID=A0A2T0RFP1_9ACTN|nr:hypothetical protein [Pseudosporangium ferrugineum]PRY19988.1 hypothetical protein CLV70_12626 [Pseudosporangium ferrugineum]
MAEHLEAARDVRNLGLVVDINSDHLVGYQLRIWSAPIEGPRFSEQTALIKSSGADFDGGSKSWWIPLARSLDGDETGLDILFRAARDYGTHVVLVPPKASSEEPR